MYPGKAKNSTDKLSKAASTFDELAGAIEGTVTVVAAVIAVPEKIKV